MTRYPARLLERSSPPATEPLTLAEAKLFLRVDGSEDDALIGDIVVAVREAAERHLRASLIMQSWKLAFDDAAPERTPLPMGPVTAVTSVTLIAEGGGETAMSGSLYHLNASRETLVFAQAAIAHRVEILYAAGYGDGSDVPQPIRQGMLLHAAALYGRRDLSGALPAAASDLYRAYRRAAL